MIMNMQVADVYLKLELASDMKHLPPYPKSYEAPAALSKIQERKDVI
jgi:hypothetical protein